MAVTDKSTFFNFSESAILVLPFEFRKSVHPRTEVETVEFSFSQRLSDPIEKTYFKSREMRARQICFKVPTSGMMFFYKGETKEMNFSFCFRLDRF